jgi:hypothetical protein
MEHFEYKVVPAPRRGIRTKGAKGTAGKFAGAMENVLNKLGASGWEYIRAESLPVDERQGLAMRKTESYQNVLIFRKLVQNDKADTAVTPSLEDQTTPKEDEGLFDDINEDFPEDEDTLEEVLTEADDTDSDETDSDDTSKDEETKA